MALSHIVMHLALCSSAAGLKTQTSVPVHVVVVDKVNHHLVNQTVRVATSGAADSTTEFDIPWGLYLAEASVRSGRASCSAAQFFNVLRDHDRQVTVHLQNGFAAPPVPVIINGDVPAEFSYADPEIVIFGKDAKCDAPVGDPIAATIDQQDDDQAYYATVYPSAVLEQNAPVTPAIKLKDSAGGYHYLKMPKNFIDFASRRPSIAELDIKDELIDFIAGKPEDTLLCFRGYETTTESH